MKSFGKKYRLLREETGTCPGHSNVEIYREEQSVSHWCCTNNIKASLKLRGNFALKSTALSFSKVLRAKSKKQQKTTAGETNVESKGNFVPSGNKIASYTHTHTFKCFLFYYCSLSYPISFYLFCLYIIRKNKEGESSLSSFSPSLTHTHTHLKPKMTSREHCISELSKISEKL